MKVWMSAAAAALALGACNPQTEAPAPQEQARPVTIGSGEYALDPNHSTIIVRARHFGLAHYVLRFNRMSGTLSFNAEDPTQSRLTAQVDVTSLDTPYGGDRDFDAELQNSEWLNSANHPIATFTSTGIERTGPNTARITGDLTLRGVTHPLTLEATYQGSHARHPAGAPIAMIGFSARGAITRSAYGVNALQPSAAGAPDGVGDSVDVLIEAEFTRPIEQASEQPA